MKIQLLSLGVALILSYKYALGQELETGSQPHLSLKYLLEHKSPLNRDKWRLPPSFSNPPTSPPSWQPTPGEWFLGTWYFYASNQATYVDLYEDMQWTLTTIGSSSTTQPFPQLLNDLTTGFIRTGTPATPSTAIYGVDTPIAPDAYAYHPTGVLESGNNTWEVLSWGYDAHLVPFAVLYETQAAGQTSATIDFISRRRAGIASETYTQLLAQVADLGSAELTALAHNVTLLLQDSRRDGEPFPSCNATCMTNAYNGFIPA